MYTNPFLSFSLSFFGTFFYFIFIIIILATSTSIEPKFKEYTTVLKE